MSYILVGVGCLCFGVVLGLVIAFSGITEEEDHLKPLNPGMESFKRYTRPDKKEGL